MTMMCMAALLLMAVSCKKEKANETYSGEGFRATTESHTGDGDSKTQLNSDLSVTWCDGDEIKVFSGSDSRGKEFSAASAGTIADFNPVDAVTDAFFTPPYTAFYPYDSETGINQISLKGTQLYTTFDDGNGNKVLTFASGENPMATQSNSKVLPFKNLCGILKFQLYSASPCKVMSLRVTSLKSGEQLWGTGTVTFDGTDATLGTLANGGQSIILDCSNKDVELGTVDDPTEFMVVIPDGALSQGFTVTVTDANNKVWSKTTTANNTITKSKIKAMPKLPVTTHTPVSPKTVNVTTCVDCTLSVGGTVTVPTGTYTCEFGIVYSETDNTPTIEGGAQKIMAGIATFSGSKTFTADITGLTANITYYVRAYAMIDGITYSTEVKTVTVGDVPQDMTWTNGKSPFTFTVASSGSVKRVYFSQGNLQYTTTGSHSVAGGGTETGTWRFAEHQFDIIGADNKNAAQTYTGWIDLFGWGTSGWNNGNYYYRPYNINSKDPSIGYGYGPKNGTSYLVDLTDAYAKADWGVYNAISNGGGNSWRTLTRLEYNYLINSRTNHDKLYGLGRVGNCTTGLIILPDNNQWVIPTGLKFTPGVTNKGFEANVYTYSQWAQMEAAGAVFLPAAGLRDVASVRYVVSSGYYWSSSHSDFDFAYYLGFSSGAVSPNGDGYRCYGRSVRLVTNAN